MRSLSLITICSILATVSCQLITTQTIPTDTMSSILSAQSHACTTMNVQPSSPLCSPHVFDELDTTQAMSLLCCNVPGTGTSSICNGALCPTGNFPNLIIPTGTPTQDPKTILNVTQVSNAFDSISNDNNNINDCAECNTLPPNYDYECGCIPTQAPTTQPPSACPCEIIPTPCPTITVPCSQSNAPNICCTCDECVPSVTYPCVGNTIQYYDVATTSMQTIPYSKTLAAQATPAPTISGVYTGGYTAPQYTYVSHANTHISNMAAIGTIVSVIAMIL